ncbi:MAG TPA: HD domain-containing phosphohydrolase [bacterium]
MHDKKQGKRMDKLKEELFYKTVALEKAKNKINDLTKNLSLNQKIISSTIGSKVLRSATQNLLMFLQKSMRLDEIAIMLYDPAKDMLTHFASVGLSARKKDAKFFPGNGITGFAFEKKKKIFIERVGEHIKFKHWGVRSDFYRNKTFLSIPMMEKERPIGVINICGDTIPSEYVKSFEILAKTLTPLLNLRMIKEKQEHDFYLMIRKIMDFAEALNPYTYGHSFRVQKYSFYIADILGLKQKRDTLSRGARLHDVGKLAIMDVINRAEKLSEKDIDIIRLHPVLGVEFVKGFSFLRDTIPIVKYHHERMDGKGYPGELEGMRIPLLTRIVSVADTYDAITSERFYRGEQEIDYAVNELKRVSGTQLDTDIVTAFLKNENYLSKITAETHKNVNEELKQELKIV